MCHKPNFHRGVGEGGRGGLFVVFALLLFLLGFVCWGGGVFVLFCVCFLFFVVVVFVCMGFFLV